ncbi:MAG: hypothetical protein HOP17_09075 [Acidobacteria bacterium]|nr:hypothetical protein [Acidobacteriota bacterium]
MIEDLNEENAWGEIIVMPPTIAGLQPAQCNNANQQKGRYRTSSSGFLCPVPSTEHGKSVRTAAVQILEEKLSELSQEANTERYTESSFFG